MQLGCMQLLTIRDRRISSLPSLTSIYTSLILVDFSRESGRYCGWPVWPVVNAYNKPTKVE